METTRKMLWNFVLWTLLFCKIKCDERKLFQNKSGFGYGDYQDYDESWDYVDVFGYMYPNEPSKPIEVLHEIVEEQKVHVEKRKNQSITLPCFDYRIKEHTPLELDIKISKSDQDDKWTHLSTYRNPWAKNPDRNFNETGEMPEGVSIDGFDFGGPPYVVTSTQGNYTCKIVMGKTDCLEEDTFISCSRYEIMRSIEVENTEHFEVITKYREAVLVGNEPVFFDCGSPEIIIDGIEPGQAIKNHREVSLIKYGQRDEEVLAQCNITSDNLLDQNEEDSNNFEIVDAKYGIQIDQNFVGSGGKFVCKTKMLSNTEYQRLCIYREENYDGHIRMRPCGEIIFEEEAYIYKRTDHIFISKQNRTDDTMIGSLGMDFSVSSDRNEKIECVVEALGREWREYEEIRKTRSEMKLRCCGGDNQCNQMKFNWQESSLSGSNMIIFPMEYSDSKSGVAAKIRIRSVRANGQNLLGICPYEFGKRTRIETVKTVLGTAALIYFAVVISIVVKITKYLLEKKRRTSNLGTGALEENVRLRRGLPEPVDSALPREIGNGNSLGLGVNLRETTV